MVAAMTVDAEIGEANGLLGFTIVPLKFYRLRFDPRKVGMRSSM
jgi:hypothetical protein